MYISWLVSITASAFTAFKSPSNQQSKAVKLINQLLVAKQQPSRQSKQWTSNQQTGHCCPTLFSILEITKMFHLSSCFNILAPLLSNLNIFKILFVSMGKIRPNLSITSIVYKMQIFSVCRV